MSIEVQIHSARRFLRSLNVSLKTARMYGVAHQRTREQADVAWADLEKAMLEAGAEGLLLGLAGGKLLVNGEAIDASVVERGFVQSLAGAGVSSLQIAPQVNREDFQKLLDALEVGGPKSSPVAEQLGSALAGTTIRINQFRYVAEDSSKPQHHETDSLTSFGNGGYIAGMGESGGSGSGGGGGVGGTLADTLLGLVVGGAGGEGGGAGAGVWNDPVKWLQMMVRAEGGAGKPQEYSGEAGTGEFIFGGSEAEREATLPAEREAASEGWAAETPLNDDEVVGLLQVLGRLGKVSTEGAGSGTGTVVVHKEVNGMAPAARVTLQQALVALSQSGPKRAADSHVLVELAEHLAIRHALQKFDRGDVKIDGVRGMLGRMGDEIRKLRQLLGLHEEKMRKAGLGVESAAEMLDQQFWASVPDKGKQSVLLSDDAWCIPAASVRQYAGELTRRGEMGTAKKVLTAYAKCVRSVEAEARKKVAAGLREMAEELAGEETGEALAFAVRQAGEQLSREDDAELRGALSATFLKLGQTAIERRKFGAVAQAAAALELIQDRQPATARELKPRMSIENRVVEFVEGVVTAPKPDPFRDPPLITDELVAVLERCGDTAVDAMTARLSRCVKVEERERLVELAGRLGEKTVARLKEKFAGKPMHEAVASAGLLSRLEAGAVHVDPARLRGAPLTTQWTMMHQLAVAGSRECPALLAGLFESVDPRLVGPLVEEIGLVASEGMEVVPTELMARLMKLAEGKEQAAGKAMVQLKTIEALGRMKAGAAAGLLKKLVESKQMWRWQYPHELRMVAAQALAKMDPMWARGALAANDINEEEYRLGPLDMPAGSAWTRGRRYRRVAMPKPMAGILGTSQGDVAVEVYSLSLGGGQAEFKTTLAPGMEMDLVLKPGRMLGLPLPLGNIKTKILLRFRRPQLVGFDFLEMDFEDRWRLRQFLASAIAKAK